jgi:hypothetical protein
MKRYKVIIEISHVQWQVKCISLRIGSSNHKCALSCHHDTWLILSFLRRSLHCVQETLGNTRRPLDARLIVPFWLVVRWTLLNPVT